MNKTLIVVILVLIVGLGGYFLFKNSTKSPAPAANQNTDQNLPQTGSGADKVSIKNFAFDPPVLNIKAGETVTWTNEDSATHKIKSDAFESGDLSQGGSFQFKFENKGTYDYFCLIHPSMKGKIIVE
jgi:plastocyanin